MEETIGPRINVLVVSIEAKCITLLELVGIGRGWADVKDILGMVLSSKH